MVFVISVCERMHVNECMCVYTCVCMVFVVIVLGIIILYCSSVTFAVSQYMRRGEPASLSVSSVAFIYLFLLLPLGCCCTRVTRTAARSVSHDAPLAAAYVAVACTAASTADTPASTTAGTNAASKTLRITCACVVH